MLIVLIFLTAGVVLVRLQITHIRRVSLDRRNILESVQDVLDQPHLQQLGIDYPVLTGSYRGRPVTLRFIVDTLALRELPTLWLSVTLHEPLPLAGPLDILLRPSPSDIVSPGERFPFQHDVPLSWPEHVRLATPSGILPSRLALAAALPLLHDRRTKDILLSPAGARLITEIARADLGQYRMVRRSKFDVRLTKAKLSAVLDSVCDMTHSLERASAPGSGLQT